jgi:hypothetical protein
MRAKLGSVVAVTLGLAGCVSTATLYPVNNEAKVNGVLTAKYQNYGTGGGKITLTLKDGEVLTGEYTTADTSSYGFGNVYASVYGTGGSASGVGTASTVSVAGSSPGVATMYGDRGTSMTCEYFVSNWTGKGAGACKASDGALYRVHF